MIASFLPDSMSKIPFDEFKAKFLYKNRLDYAGRKALVEADNMGLSTQNKRGFDPTDEYDEARVRRGLFFDSVNPMTNSYFFRNIKEGYWGGTALFYLFYLMDLPSQDFNTAITRGDNVPIDANYVLSGSTSISYGNVARCYSKHGKLKYNRRGGGEGEECLSGAADEFFTAYLPPRFYERTPGTPLDPELHTGLTCHQLATLSKRALTSYFAGP
jgi:hypothetical protein